MHEPRINDKQPDSLPVYESHPSGWVPSVHKAADLGYAGFHPPRPGQDEDVLSESNVKNGFILGHSVSAETFSAQAMINENLHVGDTLAKLEELMDEVFIRRAEHVLPVPPSTFRIPTRVTLNDSKRQAWFADLANPEVPLHKLGKSVPHGAKGHDLLDLLHSNNVAIPRAVWFLRVFGANETAGLRNRPAYNPTQYSIDWANMVTGYMKKQLNDIALPSAPRPGLNIKQTFKGVLSDSDTRERWISRFTYCLKLLRTFYAEGLVDHKSFLVWLVQQMGSCNLAQAGFITRLTDEYLDDIVISRALARPLVDACLSKLTEICVTFAQEHLSDTEELLTALLQRLCLAIPDAFVSPRLWSAYSALLQKVVAEDSMTRLNHNHIEQNIRDIRHSLLHNFQDITRRNEAMLFRNILSHGSSRLETAVSDIKLLNSISSDTDMHQVDFFGNEFDDTPLFKDKLDMLLTWSVTPLQFGDHRPFAAVTLIRIWRDKACERATRRDMNTPNEFLQDQLFEWLDASDVAGEPTNIRAVALLYGKLVKHELFSYPCYIQRLIARGERGLSYTEAPESRHRRFLRWIPLFNSTPSLVNQRKVILHGVRARETPEDLAESAMRKEIRIALPEIFTTPNHSSLTSCSALSQQCTTLMSASRFEQVRTFRQWLLPELQKHLAMHIPDTSVMKAYCLSVELMAAAKCFHSILDLTLCMLQHPTNGNSLICVIDTLRRYATIWTCMDTIPAIVTALDAAHQLWKIRGIQSRPLLSLLIEFDHGQYLRDSSRERILADIGAFTLALQPLSNRPETVPNVLPEILLLAGDPDPEAPSLLTNGLWIKYRMSIDWAWKVWDNTVASIRQIPVMTSDIDDRIACALRYGTFLWHVDQHLPNGLDGDVLEWFLGPGKNEVAALGADTWEVLTVVLSYLCVHGALETTTILKGLVYPAWQSGVSAAGSNREIYIRAANSLCHRLLLQEDGTGTASPPTDLFEVQCIITRSRSVFCEPHFPLLVESMPLLIALENSADISEDLRDECNVLRHKICQDSRFRQGAYRNLDIIREAFENSPYLTDTTSETLGKHTLAGLRMILGDSSDETQLYDWPEVTCLLSPWKIAATAIQMQFTIKQLGRALIQEPTHNVASANLDKLTLMVFHNTNTSEEASYVGEMARGADITVASKFINNGLKCIADILLETPVNSLNLVPPTFQRVGELLRILIVVAKPFRDNTSILPNLDASIQDQFMEAISTNIIAIGSAVTSGKCKRDDQSQYTQNLILMARLFHFALAFHTTWSQKMKVLSIGLSDTMFRLALFYASDNSLDLLVYPLLIDTLLYLYDEIPSENKATFDPFRNYPNLTPADIPANVPIEYRRQLISILSYFSTDNLASSLVSSHRDTAGNLVHNTAVINRPWEWIENLGEPSTTDAMGDRSDRAKYAVKNAGSLSLESFGTRLTGDGIMRNITREYSPRIEGNIRTFEDGLTTEGVFTRDWRETRVDPNCEEPTRNTARLRNDSDGEHSGTMYNTMPRTDRRPTPRASPSSSVVSRSSARGSTTSMRHSPGYGSYGRPTNSTINEVIDVDSVGTTISSSIKGTASKRKASAVISDDEIEIIEGPVAATSAKKSRARAPPKPRAKKR
ncbi:hypothetical protein BDQ12DRAFT_21589 [Crucibulum laeve]|uniref:Mediator of RNA polymerase II transcription subunit 12 n=1 Tax=Crucibulum laeve TaxID=68775 RepID=A0A5C3MIK7_9AGAR|nr:hypothetical protein BDQ12DRAFT_21589 [Crucibulum laeve]